MRYETTLEQILDGEVYVDSRGAFTRPAPPDPSAPATDFTAWLREMNAFNDRVATSASRAFADSFRRSVRRV